MSSLVGCNEEGRRIGAGHWRATIPDEVVNRLRTLHESGIGWRRLARMFDMPPGTVRKLIYFERRGQVARVWKRIEEDVEVSADLVQRLQEVLAQGIGWRRAARRLGVPGATIRKLIYKERQQHGDEERR